MVLAYKKKQQKNRSFINFKDFKLRFGNSAIIALSSGFLSFKTIRNFYIIFKKVFKFSRSITKFWIYLNVYYIITKKPLNVRMGKGKGSRKGRLSLVKSGNSLVELKYCRFGLFYKLYRYVSIRCSFNTNYFFLRSKGTSRFNISMNNYCIKLRNLKKLKNRLYVTNRIDEILDIYGKSSDLKRYKKVFTFFNRYYNKQSVHFISEGRDEFTYSFSYMNFYLKKKIQYYYLQSKLHRYINFFWIKRVKRMKRRNKRRYKNYYLLKKYKNILKFYKEAIVTSIKKSNMYILKIKKKKLKYLIDRKKLKFYEKLNLSLVMIKNVRSSNITKFKKIKKTYLKKLKKLKKSKVQIYNWNKFHFKYNKLFIINKKNINNVLSKNYKF